MSNWCLKCLELSPENGDLFRDLCVLGRDGITHLSLIGGSRVNSIKL